MNNFEYGKQSFFKGKVNSPYNFGTYSFKEWLRGFNSAYFDNLEKVKYYEYRGRSERTYDGKRSS